MLLDEEAQAKPVRRSEKGTHDIEGMETVHATVPKLHDVLARQPF